MDEILKRLAEIKAEAEALPKDAENRLETLKALAAERSELIAKIDEHNLEVEAASPAPELKVLAQDDPPAEDEPAEDKPAEEEAPAEDKPAEDAAADVALAASAAQPTDTDVPDKPENQSALVASGNVAGMTPGDKIGVRDMDKIHRLAGNVRGKSATKVNFASFDIGLGGNALSERNGQETNTALMASATRGGVGAITAAAAFCGPDDIVLDICAAGTDARPVQGLFRTVPVKGRFRYMKTATLLDVSPGIEIFTEADQIALDVTDPDTWKPCVDLTCRDETLVTPYAIPACATIGTWQQLSAPEQVANWLTQMQKQYSRIAETKLLDEVRRQSYVYSAGVAGGGLWTTIQPLLANVAYEVAAVNRGTTEGYVIVAPYGFLDALAADETMRGFSQNLAKQRIQAQIREDYGMTIVESYETDSTVSASYRTGVTDLNSKTLGGAATAFTMGDASPDTYPMYVMNPDSFVAGSSDVVDAGYYRDGTLVRQNLVRYFLEGMEFLEKTCDHLSFVYELSNCPNGAAPALVDGPTCTTAL